MYLKKWIIHFWTIEIATNELWLNFTSIISCLFQFVCLFSNLRHFTNFHQLWGDLVVTLNENHWIYILFNFIKILKYINYSAIPRNAIIACLITCVFLGIRVNLSNLWQMFNLEALQHKFSKGLTRVWWPFNYLTIKSSVIGRSG